jgi:UDP-N-acetyl-D-galactosamine dehydrogenase
MLKKEEISLGVIGLGYVGLPLLSAFSTHFPCTGFDINARRIQQLSAGKDTTGELDATEMQSVARARLTDDSAQLKGVNVFIVTVPTPVDKQNNPDLTPLIKASETVGRVLQKDCIVIYESTVFPGATEEVCVPILERESGLKLNVDFYAGYSPERINAGDRNRRISNIIKVTSGSNPEAADFVDWLYARIITAGTHKASSIKVAEAAKVIENTQRDLNIALVNELCIIFEKLGLDTEEVLVAAGTKWNFLNFRPGLVGGHCISVDPYYLTHKAQQIGYHPEVILAGRKINDDMGNYIASRVIKLMTRKRIHVVDSRILVMGLTFKENCPDLRNTRVVDAIKGLEDYNARIDVYDPWADPEEASSSYGINLIPSPAEKAYDAVIIAVAHQQFRELGLAAIQQWCKPEHVIFDVKYLFPIEAGLSRL